MATKTIHVNEDIYKISDLACTWDISEEEVETIKKSIKDGWKRWKYSIDTDILIEFRDAFIASIAITRNTTLFTRNISHFERIDDIKLYE